MVVGRGGVVSRRRLLFVTATGLASVLLACAAPAVPTPTTAPAKPAAPAPLSAADAEATRLASGAAAKPTAAPASTKPATVATAAPAPGAAATTPPTKPAEPKPAAQPIAGGRQVTITVATNPSPAEEARAAHFMKLHPNVKIEVAQGGTTGIGAEAVQKFLTSVAGGTAAPVVQFDRSNIGSFAHRQAFVPFDDLVKRDSIDLNRFSQANLYECTGMDGKLYAFPKLFVTRYYFINADHFKEVGLSAEEGLPDWQSFKEAVAKVTKKDATGKITRLGVEPHVDLTYTWGWSNGGRWATPDGRKATMDDPKNVEAFDFATQVDDAQGGREAVAGFVAANLNAAGLNAGGDPFINGLSSMKLMGNTFMRQIIRFAPKLNFRVAQYPMRNRTDPKQTWIAGQAWAMPRTAKEQDVAWEIVKTYVSFDSFVAAEDADKAVNDKLGVPYIPNLPAQPELDKRVAERYRTGIEQIDRTFDWGFNLMTTTPQILSRPRSPANAEMWDASNLAFEETTRKKKPAQQALKDANEKVQKVLDDAWAGR